MQIPEPNDRQFETAPAGTHLAQCYRVIDLGTQKVTFEGKEKNQHLISVAWELPEEKMADGRPFTITRRYTWSTHEKAALRHDLESWRGVPFTEKDFGPNGFNIKNILGKCCLLNIVHKESKGDTYANIASISKLMKGQQGPDRPTNEMIYLWINESLWDSSVFAKLSPKMQTTIALSPEYRAVVLGGSADEPMTMEEGEQLSDPIPF